MRPLFFLLSMLFSTLTFAQSRNIVGTFKDASGTSNFMVTFKSDSTFQYTAGEHPAFFFDHWGETFSESGKWTMIGDTIILNPQLEKKAFIKSELLEQEDPSDTGLVLTFNHINRYIDSQGNVVRTDTTQVRQLDYAFNDFKKGHRRRVTPHRSSRCTFAGYIPQETITKSRTIAISKPSQPINVMYVGCYEQQAMKAFTIKNPASTRLTFNVYSDYYQDGLLRQVRFLAKDENVLYIRQKPNGKFQKGHRLVGYQDYMLKRKKGNS